jgi:hypothetical protein
VSRTARCIRQIRTASQSVPLVGLSAAGCAEGQCIAVFAVFGTLSHGTSRSDCAASLRTVDPFVRPGKAYRPAAAFFGATGRPISVKANQQTVLTHRANRADHRHLCRVNALLELVGSVTLLPRSAEATVAVAALTVPDKSAMCSSFKLSRAVPAIIGAAEATVATEPELGSRYYPRCNCECHSASASASAPRRGPAGPGREVRAGAERCCARAAPARAR